MLRSFALLQRNAGRSAILSFAVLFAAACGGGTGDTLAGGGAALASAPSLGAASSFAVLGGSAVTCTGSTLPTVITGDVGVFSPINTGVTLTNCTVTGAVDPAAVQAGADFFTAYDSNALATAPCDQTILDAAFTGNVPALGPLAPGVYCFPAAVTFTGTTLTLDANNDPNAVWVFRIGGTTADGTGALTGTNFSVNMINGGLPCNVYWRVAEGVTMTYTVPVPPPSTSIVGTILAGGGITFTGMTGAPGSFVGRAWAKAGVTMTDMNVSNTCGAAGPGPGHCKGSGDRVTGGGFIKLPSGEKGTFAVSGGIKNGALRGTLEYDDHGLNGPKVKGKGLTNYAVVGTVTRHLEGTAKVNGVAGFTYKVDVSDNGERGRNDTFAIELFDASKASTYKASGKLAGGNIQLHKARVCEKDGHDKDGHDEDDKDGHDKDGHDKDGHEDDED